VAAGRPPAAGGGQHEQHILRQERVLRRCVDAVASMPVRALVTVGPALDPGAFHRTGDVAVVGSAPHDQVFRHASAVITHAGMGTVMRALAAGVPLVCMPQGRDQNDVAARVRWHGAGLRLGPRASAARIRAALRRVLTEPSFRDAAGRLRRAIRADLAADRAVAELEALAGAPTTLQMQKA
jgi:UDP:flavonoid glycosyltransferase YjiC (YdhE family)